MIKTRIELLKIKLTIELLLEEISKEIKTNEKIKKAEFLSDKINNNVETIGFQNTSHDDNVDDDDDDDDEEEDV